MGKRCLFYLLGLGLSFHSMAQTFPGYRTGNYTGVNGVVFNPANIADNRFKWDVNIFAINGFVGNDQSGLKFNDISRSLNADSLKSKLLQGNQKINSLSYADVLGPSIMLSLGPRTSVALTTRSRVFANAKDVNGNLVTAILDATQSGIVSPGSFNSNNAVIHATGWSEIGGSVARVFTNPGSNNFFKGGITLKYLSGTADSYLAMNSLTGTIGNAGGTTFITGPTSGNLSLNTTDNNFYNYKFGDFFESNGSGVGGDIGFVYEWRPTVDYSMYQTDRFVNKYKIRIGVALLDLGMIKFNKSNNSAASYSLDIPPGNRFNLSQFNGKSISQYKTVMDATPAYFIPGQPQSSSYQVNLPTTVQVNADWLIFGGSGLNLAAQLNINKPSGFNLYYFNAYSFTPRWENRLFSVEIPLSYNDMTQFNAGIAFRVGPFFIGSGSLLSALVHDSKQADLHVGIHFGLPYKKKIRPDTDKDGVYDDVDKCPTVAGSPKYHGCPIPDSDGDGINDEEDSCVHVPGLARYHGCPIPDTDGDGINDEEDSCVTVPGLPQFHGCPDTDGDGIPDSEDKCPTVPGVAKYHGCPIPDRDGDGVNDEVDLCPDQPGPASTHGCPVDKIVVQITSDFKNILFDFGKATIKAESVDLILHAAKIMNEQIPNSSFYIDGYTDNKGKASRNLLLSKARAQAVVDELIDAGVERSRIIARGFGMDNPKCDNKTDQGRQCNRRVEVVIRNIDQKRQQPAIKRSLKDVLH